ncbi:MAG: general secretion pathway protein [Winogradskyella sp.]
MFDRLLTYLKFGNRYCGVEHTVKNGQDCINVTVLKQSKKELLIEECFEDDSVSKLPKHKPIYLVVNNSKVLTKTIESNQKDPLKLVYKAFPNINLDEFYYEVLSQIDTHFITLCRKDDVENIINKYTNLKIPVLNFSLGNSLVGHLAGFVDQDYVFSSNARVDIQDGNVIKIEKSDTTLETYHINGLEVSSEYLLSFSGALRMALGNNESSTNYGDRSEILIDDFKQKRFFNLFLKAGGLFILGLLLINFFFFNHYFNKVNDLRQLSEINQSTKNQILKLDEIVSKKQKMVDDLLKSNVSRSSYYADRIISGLPNSILLTEFNYQPLLKRIKSGKAIELKKNSVEVSGESNDSEAFSDWISVLERKDWISHVDILVYGSASSKVSNFKIEIVLGDEQ